MPPSIAKVQHIHNHAFAGIVGQAVVSIAIIYILFNEVPSQDLIIWSAIKTILLVARSVSIFVSSSYVIDEVNATKLYRWFYFYQTLMFFSGVLWATSLYFVFQFQAADILFFFLAVFVALSGAAIATLGAIFSTYILFSFPMLLAATIALLSSPKTAHFETGLLAILGFYFLTYAAYKNSLTISTLLQRTKELEQSQKDIIQRLAIVGEYRDNDTGQHVKRMSHSCYLLAIKLGLPKHQAEQIQLSSALHDIGKIGIPDDILLSSGKLNDADWETMKTHTYIGEHILSNHSSSTMKLAAAIAVGHHEKWDGSGYPQGLAEYNIPIEVRIVSICDTFDALICERSYKSAWSVHQAVDYIQEQSGKHFDPRMVELFLEILPEITQYAEQHNDQPA